MYIQIIYGLIYFTVIFFIVVYLQIPWNSPRIAINLVAGTTQVVLAYLLSDALGARVRTQFAAVTGIALVSYLPLLGVGVNPPEISRGSNSSPVLRTTALQSPLQQLRMLLPLPRAPKSHLRVRVTLDRPYRGGSYLTASVNGQPIGRMVPMGSVKPNPGFEISFDELEVPFNLATVGAQNPMEIIIGQPIPDTNLRIVVWNSLLGYINKEQTAWWRPGPEADWLQGIPSALTGAPANGTPIVWLQNVE